MRVRLPPLSKFTTTRYESVATNELRFGTICTSVATKTKPAGTVKAPPLWSNLNPCPPELSSGNSSDTRFKIWFAGAVTCVLPPTDALAADRARNETITTRLRTEFDDMMTPPSSRGASRRAAAWQQQQPLSSSIAATHPCAQRAPFGRRTLGRVSARRAAP